MRHYNVWSFSFALFILYFSLVIFIGFQLGRIIYYRHKWRSFQFGFLFQCFLWALLRAVFFMVLDFFTVTWLFLVIYWIPVNIQFSTFSLLVVFYAHLHHQHKSEWRSFKKKYIAIWAVINITFLLLAIVWISLGVKYDEARGHEPGWLSHIHGYFTGIVFFLLVLVMASHGWRAAHLMRAAPEVCTFIGTGNQTKLIARVSFPKILGVTFALFFLFTSRCLYDFISATGQLHIIVESGTTTSALLTFIAFCLWEIIPTILVLLLFGTVAPTRLGVLSKNKHSQPPFFFFQQSPSLLVNDDRPDGTNNNNLAVTSNMSINENQSLLASEFGRASYGSNSAGSNGSGSSAGERQRMLGAGQTRVGGSSSSDEEHSSRRPSSFAFGGVNSPYVTAVSVVTQ